MVVGAESVDGEPTVLMHVSQVNLAPRADSATPQGKV